MADRFSERITCSRDLRHSALKRTAQGLRRHAHPPAHWTTRV